ncbi:MAG: dimethyl sulfoxide reductase anchor subunit [Gammaproteobacteria bacterium]|nr:dimethyl sulfoxide reductase anchor subunit [Gammaproteobacteria bacterium]MDX5375333.1 dimethyl sulfoxide reductase anchor subunit [Gammaproteobacteria bacterium]
MHPAFSVIFFTVTSGAGFGLFTLLAILHVFGLVDMTQETILWAGIIGIVLVAVGLMSSTFHLANPKNAWRAFFRFKTSWLSREGVFAVLFYPFALLYLLGVFLQGADINGFFGAMGLIGAALAVITIFSTGMIYGCLKTIRQWNTALTPANYIFMGLALGALLMVSALSYQEGADVMGVTGLTVTLLAIAALAKAVYYFWVAKVTGPTINTATGFTRAAVRLLDTGHTAGTFLTEEFGYEPDHSVVTALKTLVFALGFGLPILLLALVLAGQAGVGIAVWATVSAFLGIIAERWLFFAEARHVVNLYHGAQHT